MNIYNHFFNKFKTTQYLVEAFDDNCEGCFLQSCLNCAADLRSFTYPYTDVTFTVSMSFPTVQNSHRAFWFNAGPISERTLICISRYRIKVSFLSRMS